MKESMRIKHVWCWPQVSESVEGGPLPPLKSPLRHQPNISLTTSDPEFLRRLIILGDIPYYCARRGDVLGENGNFLFFSNRTYLIWHFIPKLYLARIVEFLVVEELQCFTLLSTIDYFDTYLFTYYLRM